MVEVFVMYVNLALCVCIISCKMKKKQCVFFAAFHTHTLMSSLLCKEFRLQFCPHPHIVAKHHLVINKSSVDNIKRSLGAREVAK